MQDGPLYEVMLSSTFRDLIDHRAHASKVLKQHRLYTIEMEDDASLSDQDMIDASLSKVDAASAYVCIIGKRYGQIRTCPTRNPSSLSLSELEFERATHRGIPISVLVMGSDYPVSDKDNEFDPTNRDKLQAFRDRAGLPHRVTANFDTWEQFLKLTPIAVADIRRALEKQLEGIEPAQSPAANTAAGALSADDVVPPPAPTFHAVKPFTQGHDFVGRDMELAQITAWANSSEPLLLFEAIGGMGKSMVTHRWVDKHALTARTDWAGRLWYSFYEEGASMNDFCVHALAYFENRPPRDFRGRPTTDLEPFVLKHLNEKPWLVVMDGLERVLVFYHRYDKAQLRDGDAVADTSNDHHDPYRCVHPADDHLLRSLATVKPSKLLASTRNMPAVLLNASGGPVAGVERQLLMGLKPEGAEQMLREAEVRGDSRRIRNYLETHFRCHPLMVGVVAGMVNAYLPAPGSFDRWLADPQGAGAVDLATLDGLATKRDHILRVAYDALEPDARKLLSTLAFFSQSVPGEVLVALNPRRPTRPQEVKRPAPLEERSDFELRRLDQQLAETTGSKAIKQAEEAVATRRKQLKERFDRLVDQHRRYEDALAEWRASPELRAAEAWLGKTTVELQKRGLLISDRLAARYDLHPMVRGFVRHALASEESALMGRVVADYAQSRLEAKYDNAVSLADLAQGIEIVTALTLGGHFEDAAKTLIGDLADAFNRLELYADCLAMLQPFFSQGWDGLPDRVSDHVTQRDLANAAAGSFTGLEAYQRAEPLARAILISAVTDERLSPVVSYLSRLAFLSAAVGKLYRRKNLLNLHMAAAHALDNKFEINNSNLRQAWLDFTRGDTESSLYFLNSVNCEDDSSEENEYLGLESLALKIELLRKSNTLTMSHLDEAFSWARRIRDRFRERKLFHVLGVFLQSQGQHEQAIAPFEHSIAMARAVYIPEGDVDADYALSLVAVGRRAEAAEIAARLGFLEEPPHPELARLYLALGQVDDARRFALAGFREAWADGPPYAFQSRLEGCREILQAVGEPEPRLPPFDQTKEKPFEFEAALLSLIEKGKAARET